jgi:hypothetical protein
MIWICGAICCFVMVAVSTLALAARSLGKKTRVRELTIVAHDLRMLSQGELRFFEDQYGAYPSAATIPLVREETGTTMSLGTTTSNDYFRQLLAAGLGDEKMFFGFRRADLRTDGARALEKDECGIAYVPGLRSSDDPTLPVAIAPVLPSRKGLDPERFEGAAVILHINGEVRTYPLRNDGKIVLGGGTLFDPTRPEWNGKTLTIAWPE